MVPALNSGLIAKLENGSSMMRELLPIQDTYEHVNVSDFTLVDADIPELDPERAGALMSSSVNGFLQVLTAGLLPTIILSSQLTNTSISQYLHAGT